MDEILTEAMIYHGPGGCPKCNNLLTVVDHEMTIMELNREGHPVSEETLMRVRACCPKCGHKQDMMRWNGMYIPYSETSRLFKIAQLRDEIEQRNLLLNNQAKGKNPFSIE